MAKRTGATNIAFHSREAQFPKKELLLFDDLAVVNLDKYILEAPHVNPKYVDYVNLLEWLKEEKVIYNHNPWLEDWLSDTESEEAVELYNALDNYNKMGYWLEQYRAKPQEDKGANYLKHHWEVKASEVRASAVQIKNRTGANAIPILHSGLYQESMPPADSGVFKIVLNKLPVLDDLVPYPDILELRKTEEFIHKRNAIIRWMSKIAEQELSQSEVQDEIEYLIGEYEQYMKIQKLKYTAGCFEGVLKGVSEIVENLIRFKPSKIVDACFSVSKSQIALKEAELKAPGRELAFISYANTLVREHKI